MSISVKEVDINKLEDYSKIPSFYYVDYIYEIKKIDSGLGGIRLEKTKIKGKGDERITESNSLYWDEKSSKYIKSYDLEETPSDWKKEFGMKNWGIFIAYDNDVPVGGAMIAYNTKGINMLSGKKDMTVLWDLRVDNDYKGKGIGYLLFEKAVEWSKKRNCIKMKIETQNINSVACEFYKRQGSVLVKIDEYPTYGYCEGETQLIWYKNL